MPRYSCLFFILSSLPLLCQAATDSPARIVSLSLCSDELVIYLSEPDRIASLTWLAAEPEYSAVAEKVADLTLTLNHGLAEEVIAAEPDLILTTAFSASAAVGLLQSLGRQVHVLPLPATVEDSYAQIRLAGKLLGRDQAAAELVNTMQQSLADSLQALRAEPGKRALFLSPNGLTYGAGTLRNDFLHSAGWVNVAATLGLEGPGRLPLEALLNADIDVIILTNPQPFDTWLADALPQHPAMRRVLADKTILLIPDAWFQCAGPSMVQAWQALAALTENSSPEFTGAAP